MCDFSLHTVKSRPAVKGEQLISHRFPSGTRGFAPLNNRGVGEEVIAVCLLPGTELSFRLPVTCDLITTPDYDGTFPSMARFTQVEKDCPNTHHDKLEFPDGRGVMLHFLDEGQVATVLQLPAAPKNKAEVEHQRRASYVW